MAKQSYKSIYKPKTVDRPSLVVGKVEMKLVSPFNERFIYLLKQKIPFNQRTWVKKERSWTFPTSKPIMAILADLTKDVFKESIDIYLNDVTLDEIEQNKVMDRSTHYSALGVKEDASSTEIKTAFREKTKLFHPDKGGENDHFHMINEAYNVLKDVKRKKRYDAALKLVTKGRRL